MKKQFYSLGLMGYPLGHSYSPTMQKAALLTARINGDYQLFPVPPLPDGYLALTSLLQSIRNRDLTGLNITIPHKQSIQPLVDRLTPLAAKIGAVNILYLENGELIGGNTDCPAFLSDLKNSFRLDKSSVKNALVMGAGGSARAVVYALHQDGWNVHVAARREAQVNDLITSLDLNNVQPIRLEAEILSSQQDITLVVNATPAGMSPKVNLSPWPKGLHLPENAAVYDLIYNPAETMLMKTAREAGLQTVNGLGMLVEQAALSFEIWTGVAAPRDAMRQSVKI